MDISHILKVVIEVVGAVIAPIVVVGIYMIWRSGHASSTHRK